MTQFDMTWSLAGSCVNVKFHTTRARWIADYIGAKFDSDSGNAYGVDCSEFERICELFRVFAATIGRPQYEQHATKGMVITGYVPATTA